MADEITVQDVISRLRLDTTPFQRSLRGANTALEGAARDGSERFGRLQSAVTMAGGALVAMSVVGAGATVGLATLGGKLEQTRVAFSVMMGSADKAAAFVEDLGKFAGKTPFQTDEIQASARSLMAFNVAAGDIIPSLTRIGDIASGVGMPIGELATLYGKAKVQGRLFAEDVNQLTGRGIPVIQEFAKQFGVTDSEVRALVESGKIGFPELEKAFVGMTSEGGRFSGMMEKQSGTIMGKWSTVASDMKTALAKIGLSMADTFSRILDVAGRFTKWLDNLSPAAKKMAGNILLVSTGLAAVAGSALLAAPAIAQVVTAVKAMGGLSAIGPLLTNPYVLAAVAIAAAVAVMGVALYKLSKTNATVRDSLSRAWGAVSGAFAVVASAATRMWAVVGPVLARLVAALAEGYAAYIVFAITQWSRFFTWLGDMWARFGPSVMAVIGAWWSVFSTFWGTVGSFLVSAWQKYGAPLLAAVRGITDGVSAVWREVVDNVRISVGAIVTVVGSILNRLSMLFTGKTLDIGATWSGFLNGLLATLNLVGGLMLYNLTNVLTGIGEGLQAIASFLSGDFVGAWSHAGKAISNIFAGISKVVEIAMHTVAGMVLNTLATTIDKAAGLVAKLPGMGGAAGLMSGAAKGLRGAAQGQFDAAGAAARSVALSAALGKMDWTGGAGAPPGAPNWLADMQKAMGGGGGGAGAGAGGKGSSAGTADAGVDIPSLPELRTKVAGIRADIAALRLDLAAAETEEERARITASMAVKEQEIADAIAVYDLRMKFVDRLKSATVASAQAALATERDLAIQAAGDNVAAKLRAEEYYQRKLAALTKDNARETLSEILNAKVANLEQQQEAARAATEKQAARDADAMRKANDTRLALFKTNLAEELNGMGFAADQARAMLEKATPAAMRLAMGGSPSSFGMGGFGGMPAMRLAAPTANIGNLSITLVEQPDGSWRAQDIRGIAMDAATVVVERRERAARGGVL